MEPSGNICPSCNQPLPADTPLGGLCPSCLIRSGFYSGTAPAAPRQKFAAPSVEELRQHFPHLEILELIGRGGMGAVYKARQPKLNRFVALKILAREAESDTARFADRFQREAQALAHMNHPNIVSVHDFGEAGGHYYLVMEFVDGLNLRQIEQGQKLTPEAALAIVPPICDALQYAHSQGVVHRDIKPENILLDKDGRVKIADFGIAKILGTDSSPAEALTGEDQRVGTPHYMAPEQVEQPTAVDHRADIYSLGVVFYEMLTGELPLGRFAPPSQKVQIDVRLDEIVLRALAKEPELRFQQASEIRTRVETLSTSATVIPPSGMPANDFDIRTWGPFATKQVKEICAHMTDQEKSKTALMAGSFGFTFPAILMTLFFAAEGGLPPAYAIVAAVILVPLMIFAARTYMRNFLASTLWARQQGIRPDDIQLDTLFQREPGGASSRNRFYHFAVLVLFFLAAIGIYMLSMDAFDHMGMLIFFMILMTSLAWGSRLPFNGRPATGSKSASLKTPQVKWSDIPWQIWVVMGMLTLEGIGNLVSIPRHPESAAWLAAKVLMISGLLLRWRLVYGISLILTLIHVVYFGAAGAFVPAGLNLVLLILLVSVYRYYMNPAPPPDSPPQPPQPPRFTKDTSATETTSHQTPIIQNLLFLVLFAGFTWAANSAVFNLLEFQRGGLEGRKQAMATWSGAALLMLTLAVWAGQRTSAVRLALLLLVATATGYAGWIAMPHPKDKVISGQIRDMATSMPLPGVKVNLSRPPAETVPEPPEVTETYWAHNDFISKENLLSKDITDLEGRYRVAVPGVTDLTYKMDPVKLVANLDGFLPNGKVFREYDQDELKWENLHLKHQLVPLVNDTTGTLTIHDESLTIKSARLISRKGLGVYIAVNAVNHTTAPQYLACEITINADRSVSASAQAGSVNTDTSRIIPNIEGWYLFTADHVEGNAPSHIKLTFARAQQNNSTIGLPNDSEVLFQWEGQLTGEDFAITNLQIPRTEPQVVLSRQVETVKSDGVQPYQYSY